MHYKLKSGCYYYQIGEKIYLRNVDLCKDFLFDGIAYDILELLDDPGGVVEEDLISVISEMYKVPAEIVQQDVCSFLLQLSEQELLETDVRAVSGARSVSCAGMEPDADAILAAPSELNTRSVSVANQVLGICMAENQLFSASMELTYRCNERCIHCYVDDTTGQGATGDVELTCEECRSVFTQLRELGCVKLLLTGGELLLRPDALPIISCACELGLLTDVYTNGCLLTQEMVDILHRMKINSLSFSLYGGNASVHDAITGIGGSFDKTLQAIQMTKRAGIDTYIKTVVLNQNADDMESLLKIGKSLQIDVTPSYTILDTHRGTDNTKHRVTNSGKLQEIMSLFRQYEPHLFRSSNKSAGDPVCSIGKSSLHINPYGDIAPCMTVPVTLGNIREDRIGDIWENSIVLKQLRELRMKDVCLSATDCKWVSHCTMCLGRCDVDSDMLLMPKDICAQAKASYYAMQSKTEND